MRVFTCSKKEVSLTNQSSGVKKMTKKDEIPDNHVQVVFLPFVPGISNACLLLFNEQIGDFVIPLKGLASMPTPTNLPWKAASCTEAAENKSLRISPEDAAG